MGLFIIDNVIDEVVQNVSNIISEVDHAEELIDSQNNEVEIDELIDAELEAYCRIIDTQNDEMELDEFIEFSESEISMLNF